MGGAGSVERHPKRLNRLADVFDLMQRSGREGQVQHLGGLVHVAEQVVARDTGLAQLAELGEAVPQIAVWEGRRTVTTSRARPTSERIAACSHSVTNPTTQQAQVSTS